MSCLVIACSFSGLPSRVKRGQNLRHGFNDEATVSKHYP